MNVLTLMFCGPHRERGVWTPMEHRIRGAIRVAQETGTPLAVTGDEWNGDDVNYFVAMARTRTVRAVGIVNDGKRTLTDARAALTYIGKHRPETLAVQVVTDWWHMARTLTYLHGEAKRILPDRALSLIPMPVMDGPMPPAEVIVNEGNGIVDYRLNPDAYLPRGEPYGKIGYGQKDADHIDIGVLGK